METFPPSLGAIKEVVGVLKVKGRMYQRGLWVEVLSNKC